MRREVGLDLFEALSLGGVFADAALEMVHDYGEVCREPGPRLRPHRSPIPVDHRPSGVSEDLVVIFTAAKYVHKWGDVRHGSLVVGGR